MNAIAVLCSISTVVESIGVRDFLPDRLKKQFGSADNIHAAVNNESAFCSNDKLPNGL